MEEIGYSGKALKPLKRWLLLSLALTPLLVRGVNKASDLEVNLPHLFEAPFKRHSAPTFVAGKSEPLDIFMDVDRELSSLTEVYLKLMGRQDFTLFCQPLAAKNTLIHLAPSFPSQMDAELSSALRFSPLVSPLVIHAHDPAKRAASLPIVARRLDSSVVPLVITNPKALNFILSSNWECKLQTPFAAPFVKQAQPGIGHYRLAAEPPAFKQIAQLPLLTLESGTASFSADVAKAKSQPVKTFPLIAVNHPTLYISLSESSSFPSFDWERYESFTAASSCQLPAHLFSLKQMGKASAIDLFTAFNVMLSEQTGSSLEPSSWVCFASVEDHALISEPLETPKPAVSERPVDHPLYVGALPFKAAGPATQMPAAVIHVVKSFIQSMPYYYVVGKGPGIIDSAQSAVYIYNPLNSFSDRSLTSPLAISNKLNVYTPSLMVAPHILYKETVGLPARAVKVAAARYQGHGGLPSLNTGVITSKKMTATLAGDADCALPQVVVSAFGMYTTSMPSQESSELAVMNVYCKAGSHLESSPVNVTQIPRRLLTSAPDLIAGKIDSKTPAPWIASPKEIYFAGHVHDVFPRHGYGLDHVSQRQQLGGASSVGIKQRDTTKAAEVHLEIASRSTKWASSVYEDRSYLAVKERRAAKYAPYIVAGPVDSKHVPIILEKSDAYLSIPGSFALFERAPFTAPRMAALASPTPGKTLDISKRSKAPIVGSNTLLDQPQLANNDLVLIASNEAHDDVQTPPTVPLVVATPKSTRLAFSNGYMPMFTRLGVKHYSESLNIAFMKTKPGSGKVLPPVSPSYRMIHSWYPQTYQPFLYENLFGKEPRDVLHLARIKGLSSSSQGDLLVYSPDLLTSESFMASRPRSIYVPAETLGDRLSIAWLQPGPMKPEELLYVDTGASVSSPEFVWQLGRARLTSYHSEAEELIAAYKKEIAKSFALSTPGFFFHENDVVLASRYISNMDYRQKRLVTYMQDQLAYEHIHLNDSYLCDVQYAYNDQLEQYEFEIALTPKQRVNHPKTPQNFIFIIDNSADVNSQRFAGFKKGIAKSLAYIDPSDSIALIHAGKNFTAPFNEPALASGETKSYLSRFVNGLKYSGYYSKKTLPSMIEHASEFFVRGRENVVIVLSESHAFNNVRSLQHFMKQFSEEQSHDFAIYAATCRASQGLEGAKLVTQLHQGSFCNSSSVASFPRNLALMVKHACHTISSHLEISLDGASSDNVTIYPSMLSSTLFSDEPFKLYGASKDLTAFAIDIKAHSRDALLSLPLYIDLASAKENSNASMYQTLEKQKALSFLHTAYYSDGDVFLECFDSIVKNGSLDTTSPLVFR